MNQLRIVLNFLKLQWKRILLAAVLSVFVFIFLFPMSDLRDTITARISFMTGRTVYVDFEKLNFKFLSGPGIIVEDLEAELAGISPLKIQKVSASPAVGGLIGSIFSGQVQPYGLYEAEGLFKGNLSAKLSHGSATENGVERMKVEIMTENVTLTEIGKMAKLPMAIKGRLDLQSTSQIDLTFAEQPDGDVTLTISNFDLPSATFESMMGAVATPQIALKKVQLTGRLNNGKFYVDKGSFGEGADELSGAVKGNIQLSLNNENGRITPRFGAYEFEVDMNMKKSFEEKGQLILILIENYKIPTETGSKFKFKMAGANFYGPPNFTTIK